MRPLRILHVTPYFVDAWAYGGIPRLAHTLARGLARRGHHVTVCTTDVRDSASRTRAPARICTRDGVEVCTFANLSNRLAYHLQLFLPRGLHAFMERHAASFDVAHLHACRNLPGVIAARHLRGSGVPYLVAPNGTAPRIERRRFAKLAFDAFAGRRVMRDASRVLAVSTAECRQLAALGIPDARVRVVPNPVDLDEFASPPSRGAFRRRLGRTSEDRLVLFLGRLSPRKRLDVVVRAFARLADRRAHLVIAGNDMGAERGTRSLARDLGVSGSTTFAGLLEGLARLEALTDADVVVYPSEHEIFGLVPLEALLAGTPVVVADDSGCGDIVRASGGGHVVRVGDVDALAGAIRAVLADPARWRAAAHAATPRIREAFGDDVISGRLEAVYADMMGAA